MTAIRRVVPFSELGRQDVGSSEERMRPWGELTVRLGTAGVRVPGGFATTADAYAELLATERLRATLKEQIDELHAGAPLNEVGAGACAAVLATPLPPALESDLAAAYRCTRQRGGPPGPGRRGAQQRHGRGPAGGELRGSAGHLPQCSRPAAAARHVPSLLRVAVHGPSDRLPGAHGL